jgi:acyl-CoA thioester hydrolase
MPAVFDYGHTVADDEIDSLGHANNVAYVAWLQAAALAHTAAQGWPAERYRALGCGWVVRSHEIHYHRPAAAGEQIVVRTWVATMQKATSIRRYRVHRRSDGALLAEAETRWAFVDYATGQPRRVPPEVAAAFVVLAAGPPAADPPELLDNS